MSEPMVLERVTVYFRDELSLQTKLERSNGIWNSSDRNASELVLPFTSMERLNQQMDQIYHIYHILQDHL